MLKGHQSATDRPSTYLFHGIMSPIQSGTIGACPWDRAGCNAMLAGKPWVDCASGITYNIGTFPI